jgi:hypothetical protein
LAVLLLAALNFTHGLVTNTRPDSGQHHGMNHKTVLVWLIGVLALAAVGCGRRPPMGPPPEESEVRRIRDALLAAAPGAAGTVADAAALQRTGWGTLRGRFVFDGAPPGPRSITPTKDLEVCGKHDLYDESLVVGSDGGLANVVVFLRSPPGEIHEAYDARKGEAVVLDNLHCRFEPHVVGLWTEQKLKLKNSDPVGHNTKADLNNNESFNVLLSAGVGEDRTFGEAETQPAGVVCSIHPWMGAYVLIRRDPYFAVSGANGTFEIAHLPAGRPLEFQVWHERAAGSQNALAGPPRVVDAASGQPLDLKWSDRGRFELKLEPDESKDVLITVPASAFRGT